MNYQDGESTLNSMKSELIRHRSIKKDAQSDYIRMMTIDMEEIPDLAEIKDLLLQDETNEAIKLKYSIALQEEDFTTAQNLLNQYVSTTDDDAWVEFQELAQEIKAIGKIEEITTDQIATLESFIANNKRERHVAKVLLWLATGEEYVEDIEIPDDSNNKSFIGTGKGKKEIALVDLPELTVFPNPASDEVFFTFELPKDMGNTIIKIYSAEGKLVYNEDITGNKGMYRVDISKLSEGNYLTEILVDNIQVMNAKFIKK